MIVDPAAELPALKSATVGDPMRRGVLTCSPDDGLATLAAIFVTHGIHAAVLAPLGRANPMIVTDRDLMRAALERPADAPLSAIAREAAATIPSDATLEAAGTMMAERFVRHLVVTDVLSGAPVGVVSSFDVVAELGGLHPHGGARPLAPRSPRHRSLLDTTVGDVMHLGIATCDADASLSAVAATMVGQRAHCVAIAGIEGAGHHLMWGLIDDLDLVMAQHRGAFGEPAASIAVTSPIAVGEADSLARAAWLMAEHDTSHVVVVGPPGLPIGIVSTLDIAGVLAHQSP